MKTLLRLIHFSICLFAQHCSYNQFEGKTQNCEEEQQTNSRHQQITGESPCCLGTLPLLAHWCTPSVSSTLTAFLLSWHLTLATLYEKLFSFNMSCLNCFFSFFPIKLCVDVPDSNITTVYLATGGPVLEMLGSCLGCLPATVSSNRHGEKKKQ